MALETLFGREEIRCQARPDEFATPDLASQWEWNYQPRAEKWSLSEHPGFLRLHAFKPLIPDDLRSAGNTLTQRSLRTEHSVVTVALDLVGMADGQVAGLTHFSRDYTTLNVRQLAGKRTLELRRNNKITPGPAIAGQLIWLRSEWGLTGLSQYSYSEDGKTFLSFGEPGQLDWADYRGDRIGLFTYNTLVEAGYIDVDWFHYDYKETKM